MRAYRLKRPGSIDGLDLVEETRPVPGRGEVLIRVDAVSLNYRDLLVIGETYPGLRLPDLVPLSDAAGTVAAVGEAVSRVKPGDRIVANFAQNWIAGPQRADTVNSSLGAAIHGVLAEYIILSEQGVIKLPSYLTAHEAASLPCAGITAWHSLVAGEPIEAGQWILVQGTGGVSLFGLQFAKSFGARVIALTSSPEKEATLHALGADAVINYRDCPDWHDQARAITGGRGVDRVLEVGGPNTLERSIACLTIGGCVALIGFVGGAGGKINPLAMIGRSISMLAISTGNRLHFEALLRAMDTHSIHPVIDRVFPFEEAVDALRHFEQRRHVGKVIIQVSNEPSDRW